MSADTLKLTAAHIREMKCAAEHRHGVVECYAPGGLAKASWYKMMERLRGAGLMTPYTFGGYEITFEGREALRKAAEATE